MSRWRSDMAAARPEEFFDAGGFCPIPIVSIDLDRPVVDDVTLAPEAVRSWVEVSRDRTVVGRIELTPHGGVLGHESLSELAAKFPEGDGRRLDVPDEDLPFATVIVPTICRSPELLLRTIQSLVELDYPRFEVLVVDNTSGPDLPLPPLPGDKVRIVKEPRRGVSSARNAGLRAAAGEFVAFTDDDAVVDARWLRG